MALEDILIDQVQLARRWRLSHRTLERWRWTGCGPSYVKIGRKVVYRLVDVEQFERDGFRETKQNDAPK